MKNPFLSQPSQPESPIASPQHSHHYRLLNIFRGSIGNLVEYFDWAIYAAFALYFAPIFFPAGDQTAQLLNNAAIFAVGFIFRPLGGWLLGRLADRKGRKYALVFSVCLMCLGSLIIACAPGYAVIGAWAPALLLFARILQGFSIGGEYGSSATYLSEMASSEQRGYYASFQYVTIVLGQILALTLLLLLQHSGLTAAQLQAWGWRIPFVVGALLAVIAINLRGKMAETTAFVEQQDTQSQLGNVRELLNYPKALFTVVGLTAGGTVSYYTFTVYMQKFLVNTTAFSKDDATLICLLALLGFMLLQPVVGWISDYLGRRRVLIAFGVGATIFTVPLLKQLAQPQSIASALGWYFCALVIVSGYSSVNAIVKAELFPVHIRALGVGLPYAITVALFGGSAEYLALWLKTLGHPDWFGYYVSSCAALALGVALWMQETLSTSALNPPNAGIEEV